MRIIKKSRISVLGELTNFEIQIDLMINSQHSEEKCGEILKTLVTLFLFDLREPLKHFKV